MQLKASDNRDNNDFDDLTLDLVKSGNDIFGKITLNTGNEIEFTLSNVSKSDIEQEFWFSFEYDGYAFDGELFYVDDDPYSDKIALNVYTTVESPDAIRDGLVMGDDIGVYADCVCHLDD
jgi:hypothetical protein